ncbi:MAG TPA: FliM/FliN family flagellar motor switch protein [Candidatus Sulfopaludibacter sp.]|nr:FliM/FliN family flagellar motor switch protein [Candidatus Sulfopaludibacter sp.]
MTTYLECWTECAGTLFAQALAGEPELVESFPRPLDPGSFGWEATLEGDPSGRFSVTVDGAILDAPLLGEGPEQKGAWEELLHEVAESAAGQLLAKTGKKCRVVSFASGDIRSQVSQAFQLRQGDRAWAILVRDETSAPVNAPQEEKGAPAVKARSEPAPPRDSAANVPELSPGLELMLDVELEATLRFGCREMPLGEILELGPGDVVELDRHVTDPVDLIVGDKIVARGDVVLVNGNFGLRVTEVAAPRKRLESIRCLF